MKEVYIDPELEIIRFSEANVITASGDVSVKGSLNGEPEDEW